MLIKHTCTCSVCDRTIKEEDLEIPEEEFQKKIEEDPENNYTYENIDIGFMFTLSKCHTCLINPEDTDDDGFIPNEVFEDDDNEPD